MTDSSTDEIRSWGESARYWEKHFDTIRSMFAPVTEALIEDSGLGAGNRVLDVAGGSGEPSLTVADVVAAPGSVTYSDPSAEMLAAARRNAVRFRVPNIWFCQTSGDAVMHSLFGPIISMRSYAGLGRCSFRNRELR